VGSGNTAPRVLNFSFTPRGKGSLCQLGRWEDINVRKKLALRIWAALISLRVGSSGNIKKKLVLRMWTGFIWLRVGSSGNIKKKLVLRMWTGFIWLRVISVADSCENGNEPSGSVKGREFDWVSSCLIAAACTC
jgi:hypothetical protein